MKQLANNSTAADANAAKSVSLDHLGSIAVRIYKITNAERPAENEEAVHLRSLPQVGFPCFINMVALTLWYRSLMSRLEAVSEH